MQQPSSPERTSAVSEASRNRQTQQQPPSPERTSAVSEASRNRQTQQPSTSKNRLTQQPSTSERTSPVSKASRYRQMQQPSERSSAVSKVTRNRQTQQQPSLSERMHLSSDEFEKTVTKSRGNEGTDTVRSVTSRVSAKQSRSQRSGKDGPSSPGANRILRASTCSRNSNPTAEHSSKRKDPLIRAGTDKRNRNAGNTGDSVDCARHAEAASLEQPSTSVASSGAGNELATALHLKSVHSERIRSSRIADRTTTPVTQHSDSQTNSEMEASNVHGRIRRNLSDWLAHSARSEDPQQRRLRRLKLTEELLNKVEECLRQPCT